MLPYIGWCDVYLLEKDALKAKNSCKYIWQHWPQNAFWNDIHNSQFLATFGGIFPTNGKNESDLYNDLNQFF